MCKMGYTVQNPTNRLGNFRVLLDKPLDYFVYCEFAVLFFVDTYRVA